MKTSRTRVVIAALALLLALVVVGCGGKDKNPLAPEDCKSRNTATLILVNNALVSRDAYIDGAFVGTLGSSGGTLSREVTAGVAHPVVFRSAVSGVTVSSASPNLIQCDSFTLTNSF